MKNHLFLITIIFFIVLFLSGCASTGQTYVVHKMYDGQELLPTQVSFVQIEDAEGWETTFRTVDSKRPPAGTKKIAVLPGKHDIVIDVVLTESSGGITSKVEGFKDIELDAIAGAFYVIEEGNIRQVTE